VPHPAAMMSARMAPGARQLREWLVFMAYTFGRNDSHVKR
jgi:hypothetical protein